MAKVDAHFQELQAFLNTAVVQAFGKVPVERMGYLGDADMVTIVGHKFGDPKGIATLYVRPGCLD